MTDVSKALAIKSLFNISADELIKSYIHVKHLLPLHFSPIWHLPLSLLKNKMERLSKDIFQHSLNSTQGAVHRVFLGGSTFKPIASYNRLLPLKDKMKAFPPPTAFQS